MPLQSIEEALQAPDPKTSHRLFQTGATGLICAMIWLSHKSNLHDSLLLVLGNIVMVLGALPALNWARKSHTHFPVFEMFMLTSIPFYAMPLLAGHPDVLVFSDGATLQAAVAMILFQLCAISTFLGVKAKPAKTPLLTVTLLPEIAQRYAQTGIWLNTVYLYINGFTGAIPHELLTVFRAIFFGLGTVSLFIEMRRWGARQLNSSEKLAIGFNIFAQLVLLFRDLYLISGISILLLALIGFVSTSRRIPVVAILIILPVVAILHSGKSVMRFQYWEQRAPAPTLTELPAFFQSWIEHGLEDHPSDKDSDNGSGSLAGRLFERASLFQMLCLVTERTPELEPFLLGESYRYIPSQIIPSFLWPDKPSSLTSNVMLAVHYHLVAEDATTTVSIAFGMIAEAYANFGLTGCASLGLLLGFAYKRISIAAVGCPQFSALGLFTILLAAWSFQVEQIFASWLVSLFQAGTVVIGIPLLFRILFRQE